MKIVVLIKYTPELTGDRRFAADGTTDRAAVPGVLSELDEYAVEQALRIAEAHGDVDITFVTMGPPQASTALRKALSMGGNRAVHVVDDALHGCDVLATAQVLEATVHRLGFDLLICGMASTDAGMGVLPALLAEHLALPQLTYAGSLRVQDGQVQIERATDEAVESLVGPLPVLVSVTDRSGEPRYPSFKGIMAAKKKPVETWSLADIGVDAGLVGLGAARSTTLSWDPRPPRQRGQQVTDDGSGGPMIADYLAQQRLL